MIDSLLADYKKPEDLIGEHGLLKPLTRKLVERALEAEMAEHLGHACKSKKTLKDEFGEVSIEIPLRPPRQF